MTPDFDAAPVGATAHPRIAVVSHSHPSISKGGAEISAYALYRGLKQLGVDAIFIGACNRADRHKLSFAGPDEYAVEYDGDRYDHFYHVAPKALEDQLLAILQERRIEIVNFHHFYNLGLNTLRRIRAMPGLKLHLTIHEFLAICHNHGQMITRPGQILCERATLDDCTACFPESSRSQFMARKATMLEAFGEFDGFISPSRFLAGRFVEWGLDPARMTVIENGLLSVPPMNRPPKTDKTWVFGFFGQINPFKGVDVVLQAADLLAADAALSAKVRFRIHGNLIGQSPEFLETFDAAVKKHPFLTFAGAYNNASVHRLMSECDYVLVPSKWWENSPVVIQEAYAAGSPLICTGIGGMAEKVPDGKSGLHFRLGDANDLLRAVQLATDPRNAAVLREGIPPVITAAGMAEAYLAFFRDGIIAADPAAERRTA